MLHKYNVKFKIKILHCVHVEIDLVIKTKHFNSREAQFDTVKEFFEVVQELHVCLTT